MGAHLTLDDTHTYIAGQAGTVDLAIGIETLLRRGLGEFPPSEVALENAIADVEDALMPQIAALRGQPLDALNYAGPQQQALRTALGRQDVYSLSLEQVEQVFNQLVAVVEGLPAHQQDIAEDPGFVATLVIIRELMHHTGYQRLQLVH